MSRIPQAFIQDLLSRTDIVEVVGSRVELKRAGREYKGLSPFTNEKTPSFFVSPAKQMYFCFSSGKNGNAIGFLMDNDRLSFVEAVEELAKRAGLAVPREGGDAAPQLVLEGPLDALAAAERYYRAQLRTHQPAIDYLKRRGLSGDTAKLFGIGYAPDSWDALTRQFSEPAYALTAGLLIERDGGGVYDRFRNRIMFPIRDSRGRVIAFGGRTLANDPAKYLNSPETPLFHKGRNLFGLYEAKQSSKSELPYVLVVEGYMDVVMLAQYGIRNAVATLGTATTREHLPLLFKATSRIVFCFDGDRAGRAAAWRALEQGLPEIYEGRECRFMFLPEGQDPDTLVQQIGADAFRSLADQAQPLSEFLLGELEKKTTLASAEGRARLAALAKPYLDQVRDGALDQTLMTELEKRTRMRREDIAAAFTRSRGQPQASAGAPAKRPELPGVRPVKRALQLLLERPELAPRVQHLEQLAEAVQPGLDILVAAIEFFREQPQFKAGQLLELWRGTARGEALSRILGSEVPLDQEALEREFDDAISLLRRRALRGRTQALLDLARARSLTAAETQELNLLTRQLAEPAAAAQAGLTPSN